MNLTHIRNITDADAFQLEQEVDRLDERPSTIGMRRSTQFAAPYFVFKTQEPNEEADEEAEATTFRKKPKRVPKKSWKERRTRRQYS